MFNPNSPTPDNVQLEALVRTAIASGQLLSDAESEIDRILDSTPLTDRDLRLMMILQDAIANGDVKRVEKSSQTLHTSLHQPQKTKVGFLSE